MVHFIVITNNSNVEVRSDRDYRQGVLWVGEPHQEEVGWVHTRLEGDGLWEHVSELEAPTGLRGQHPIQAQPFQHREVP